MSRESRFDERNLAVTSDGTFDGAASPFRSSSGSGGGGGGDSGGCDRDHRGGGFIANERGYVDLGLDDAPLTAVAVTVGRSE